MSLLFSLSFLHCTEEGQKKYLKNAPGTTSKLAVCEEDMMRLDHLDGILIKLWIQHGAAEKHITFFILLIAILQRLKKAMLFV